MYIKILNFHVNENIFCKWKGINFKKIINVHNNKNRVETVSKNIHYDIRSNLSPGKRLLLPSVINIYELRLLYETAKLKLYSSGANPILHICFTLMGSLFNTWWLYAGIKGRISAIGNMYKSNNFHVSSPVKCYSNLNSNFPKTFAR